jgi:hypothetical protein
LLRGVPLQARPRREEAEGGRVTADELQAIVDGLSGQARALGLSGLVVIGVNEDAGGADVTMSMTHCGGSNPRASMTLLRIARYTIDHAIDSYDPSREAILPRST